MVPESATPLSANARTNPPMDPFDRAILLCKQMLAMLSGPVVQPEDSDVDQELTAGCDNAASSPDGEMPAKCSTLGLSPDIGGVEAKDTSQQSGSVSTASLGPVGASPPSTMPQFGILKPDKHTPTTCSTVVLVIDTDAKSAKREMDTLQAGLASTRTADAPLPATTAPQPPDQPGFLLDRPPPWPVWIASGMHSTTHSCARLLPTLSVHLVLSSMTTTPSSTLTTAAALPSVKPRMMTLPRVESQQEQHHLLWLLPLASCGQADCLGGVKGLRTSSVASPHILSTVGLVPEANAVPATEAPLVAEVDAAQLDIREVPASTTSSPQSSVQAWVAIPSASSGVCLLPGGLENHDKLNLDSICIVLHTADNQWACKSRSWGILINCQQYNRLLVDALGRIVTWKVDGNWMYMGRSIINAIDINLTMSWDPGEHLIHCDMPRLFSCIYSQVNNSKWTGQQLTAEDVMAAYGPSAMHGCDPVGVSLYYKRIHIIVPTGGIKWAEIFSPRSMLPMLIQAAHSTTESMLPDLSAAIAICESLLPQPSPNFVASGGDSSGDLVILSITVPWNPGVCSELSTEELRFGFVEQHTSGEVLTTVSPCDHYAHCLFIYALYQDHFGKHHGAQHQCIAYISDARIEWRIAHHLSYWVLNVWPLANQLNEIQHTCQIAIQKFLVGSAGTTEPILLFDGAAVISPCQIILILVHTHHFLMENGIQAPRVSWYFWLLPGAAEQWIKSQKVQPMGVQIALLLQLLIPLQQKHGGWVFLRRILPTSQQLPHCKSDLVGCMARSPITMPWDPGAQIGLTAPDVVPSRPILDSRQLNVLWLWDPGGFHRHSAWGQAEIQGEGNVTDCTTRMGRGGLWAGVWAQDGTQCLCKRAGAGAEKEEQN